jgi:ABC-type sugar transport system substrate-binding protein
MKGSAGKWGTTKWRWIPLSLLIVLVAAVVVGCGGGGSSSSGEEGESSSSSSGPTGVQEGSGGPKEAAEEAAAKVAGKPVSLPAKKVGILQILGAIESAQRAENTIKDAIKTLGWSVTSCDAQGEPTKMASCGESLLNEGVEAIFVLGIEPSLIKAQLIKAKKMGVPMIEFSGQVEEDPNWTATYYPDEAKAGEILAASLMEKLETVEGTSDISVANYPAGWASVRTEQLEKDVEESGGKVKISAESVTDAANLVQGTEQTVTTQITQNPELKAFWFAFDSAGQAAAPVIASKYAGKEFPERPWVVTFHGDLGTLELMRKGDIDEVVDVPYDAAGWVAVDQAAQYFARKTPFDTNPQPTYGGFETYDYKTITKENLPPKGQYVEPTNDFVTFFKTKWKEEFGK